MIKWSEEDKLDLVERLDEKGLFLRTLWGLTEVYWTTEVQTAAVQLSGSVIQMVFNETFWNTLSPDGQLFIVCHEQSHLMLNHFVRLRFDQGDVHAKNIAADVAINHFLTRNYYFEPTDLPEWEKYCWVSTVFPGQAVSENETAEHYYTLLRQKQERGEQLTGQPLDDHQFGNNKGDNKQIPQDVKDAIKEAVEKVREQIAEKGNESHELASGIMSGGGSQVHSPTPKPKKNWRRVYKNITKRILTTKQRPHWVFTDRRQQLIRGAELPGSVDVELDSKVLVHIYLDTSGSCIDDARYFLNTALSLPPKQFTVRMFGFDCKVYDIPPKPPYKLTGFGGTSFQTLANHAESSVNQVDAIFVFTDGDAPPAKPNHPNKWHWFISPDGTNMHIPTHSHQYMLAEFDWRS